MSKKRYRQKKQQPRKPRSLRKELKKILQNRMVEQLLVQSILQLLRLFFEGGE